MHLWFYSGSSFSISVFPIQQNSCCSHNDNADRDLSISTSIAHRSLNGHDLLLKSCSASTSYIHQIKQKEKDRPKVETPLTLHMPFAAATTFMTQAKLIRESSTRLILLFALLFFSLSDQQQGRSSSALDWPRSSVSSCQRQLLYSPSPPSLN